MPCSSDMRSTITAGRSSRTPKPSPLTPRAGSRPSALVPASITAWPGTAVLTTVAGQAVIDAGTKALGREPVRGASGEGFGVLLGRPEVTVKSMSEEHGILDLGATSWRPEIGELVRVIPNHVCIVVHLNDVICGVRGDEVETSWPVAARGRLAVDRPAAARPA